MASGLFKKYSVPGPRYTSYPTVPYWEGVPTEKEWLSSISESLNEAEAKGVGAALYIHIPFCESLCTYCGCNTRITRNHGVSDPYLKTVLKEWKLYAERLGRLSKPFTLSEIHLGGGTPTFMSAAELTNLMEGIFEHAVKAPDAEYSVEADPRVTRRDHLEALAKLGFTRLSLGIQDFDPKVQEIVHRVQSEEQVKRVVEDARSLGYTSINFDLIYGLPFQTLTSIKQTVEAVVRLKPDRIAFYAYAHVPWIKAAQRRFTEKDLPEGDEKRALYELGRDLLEQAGYHEIGMDHFALKSDSLYHSMQSGELHRNFMGYTAKQVAPLMALGVSSIGDSWGVFLQNEKLLETYQARVEKGELPILRGHVLTDEDRVVRKHILNLMCRMETSWEPVELRIPELETVESRLEEMVRDGLVSFSGRSCRITEKGRPFLRNICMAFDVRLARKAPETRLFSQTI